MDAKHANIKTRRFDLAAIGDIAKARAVSESFNRRTKELLHVVRTGLPVIISAGRKDDQLVLKTVEPPEPVADAVRDHQGLKSALFLAVAQQLISGVAYLHEQDIAVGRIELGDVFWDGKFKNSRAAICNVPFGEFSFITDRQLTEFISHSGAFSPESPDRDTKADKKIDQYFLGRVLCQLAGGRRAVGPDSNVKKWTKRVPRQVRSVVNRLIAESPENRFSDMSSALAAFEKAAQKRTAKDLAAYLVALLLLLALLVSIFRDKGKLSEKTAESKVEIAELKLTLNSQQERIGELKSIIKDLTGSDTPTKDEIFNEASGIFKKLSAEKSADDYQTRKAAELARIGKGVLRNAVEGELAKWHNRMSHKSTWTLVFESPKKFEERESVFNFASRRC